jgi:DNA polymerase elongation subunit (family B)
MRNLLMNRGAKLGYFFDTRYQPTVTDPDATFPGAYVVPPIKGVVKPMMRFDEFLQMDNVDVDEQVLNDGYTFIEKNFEQIYHSKEKLSTTNTSEAIRSYLEYAASTENQYPVSGLDYASLYPSIIMTYNISPEKLVIDRRYAEELMDMGKQLQYVSFPFCGELMEAWFVRHGNVVNDYSVCGKLLIELFDRRAALKKVLKHYGEQIFEMEQEMKPFIECNTLDEYPRLAKYNETKFDYVSCDSKQKTVKIFMNTLYGEMGNTHSCICAVQVAGSVTAMGRHNLKLAKAFVESELKMKTYYGDSVVGDTPIIIKRNGIKELVPIEELDDRYELYVGGKECIDYSDENVYVMTEAGYSKILKVIRHRTNKKLFRVTTHIGSVIVTEDHSLLDASKNKIEPQDCVVGTELLHWDVPRVSITLAEFHIIAEGQHNAQTRYLALLEQGYQVSVTVRGRATYQLSIGSLDHNTTAIKTIEEMGECSGYVYDLETESHHFAAGVGRMVVHNTDSLYVSCNAKHFIDHDKEYFSGKIDKLVYGTKLVETTFEQIERAKSAVNAHLINDNGSQFLKMAYEEVLYPVAFLSKKKYYGVPHEDNVDFYPRKLFLRGLEIVKRGASDVLKDVINEVLLEVMDLKNTNDIISIVNRAIVRVFNTNWSIDAFAKTKVYRPDKKNVAVQRMMQRYEADNYHTIPEPNVRFKYVICKYYPWTYDFEGRGKKATIGDCMELLNRVHEEGLEIDLEYYFDNELTGQFARLITFCDEFSDATSAIEPVDVTGLTEIEVDIINKEQYNRMEDALFKAAKKFIGQLAKQYSNAYVNKGALFKSTWRETGKYIRSHPETFIKHLKVPQAIVLSMFSNAIDIQPLLLTWATRHVNARYRVVMDATMTEKLKAQLIPVLAYIKRNNLEESLTKCQVQWQQNVVKYIRAEYGYDQICNLPYATLWDVLSTEELNLILADESLFTAISPDDAMHIIDMIATAISNAMTAPQLTASV